MLAVLKSHASRQGEAEQCGEDATLAETTDKQKMTHRPPVPPHLGPRFAAASVLELLPPVSTTSVQHPSAVAAVRRSEVVLAMRGRRLILLQASVTDSCHSATDGRVEQNCCGKEKAEKKPASLESSGETRPLPVPSHHQDLKKVQNLCSF